MNFSARWNYLNFHPVMTLARNLHKLNESWKSEAPSRCAAENRFKAVEKFQLNLF